MDQRVSFVTLAVRDLGAARAFYVDGLGWRPVLDVPGEVLMLPVASTVILSLWDRAAFEAEAGPVVGDGATAPVTLAHNVATHDDVDAVLRAALAAGATSVTDGRDRDWGGYSGYFADPEGFRWEVAWNPGPTGALVLGS